MIEFRNWCLKLTLYYFLFCSVARDCQTKRQHRWSDASLAAWHSSRKKEVQSSGNEQNVLLYGKCDWKTSSENYSIHATSTERQYFVVCWHNNGIKSIWVVIENAEENITKKTGAHWWKPQAPCLRTSSSLHRWQKHRWWRRRSSCFIEHIIFLLHQFYCRFFELQMGPF